MLDTLYEVSEGKILSLSVKRETESFFEVYHSYGHTVVSVIPKPLPETYFYDKAAAFVFLNEENLADRLANLSVLYEFIQDVRENDHTLTEEEKDSLDFYFNGIEKLSLKFLTEGTNDCRSTLVPRSLYLRKE